MLTPNRVQHGLVFVGMDGQKLLRRSDTYRVMYPENEVSESESDGVSVEIAPRGEAAAAAPALPTPQPGVSVEYYRLQRVTRGADSDDINRPPEDTSDDESANAGNSLEMAVDDDDDRSRRYTLPDTRTADDLLDEMPDPEEVMNRVTGIHSRTAYNMPRIPPEPPANDDFDAFMFRAPPFSRITRRLTHPTRFWHGGSSPSFSVGHAEDGASLPRVSPPFSRQADASHGPRPYGGAVRAAPDPPRRSSEDILAFQAKFSIDKEQSRAIIKFNPPMCVSSPLFSYLLTI